MAQPSPSLRTRGVRTRGPRQGWQPPNGSSGPEILKARNKWGNVAETPATPGSRRNQSVGVDGSYHSKRKGWKHHEPLVGGPVGELEWTRPDVGPAEEQGWRCQRTGWYYIGTPIANRGQFNRASRTNYQQDSQPIRKPAGCSDEEVI